MTVHSRPTVPYQCYQAYHPWHPDCTTAASMLGKPCFRESFKIYCVLYGVRKYEFDIRYCCLSSSFLRSRVCSNWRKSNRWKTWRDSFLAIVKTRFDQHFFLVFMECFLCLHSVLDGRLIDFSPNESWNKNCDLDVWQDTSVITNCSYIYYVSPIQLFSSNEKAGKEKLLYRQMSIEQTVENIPEWFVYELKKNILEWVHCLSALKSYFWWKHNSTNFSSVTMKMKKSTVVLTVAKIQRWLTGERTKVESHENISSTRLTINSENEFNFVRLVVALWHFTWLIW